MPAGVCLDFAARAALLFTVASKRQYRYFRIYGSIFKISVFLPLKKPPPDTGGT